MVLAMHAEHGQGTVEYIAAILAVALLITVAGAAGTAPAVTNALSRGIQRAYCLVTGGRGCTTLQPLPCIVHTTTLKGSVTAKIALLRAGRDTALVRSESSDGTISITLLDHLSAGLNAELGAHGRLQLAG